MKELKKKPNEEMLIVHKSANKPDPDITGRNPVETPLGGALDRQDFELLKRQITLVKDPSERRVLIARIQKRFGNDKAMEVIRELREKSSDDESRPRVPLAQQTGKVKA